MASIEDRIEGRDVPRRIDQTHALSLVLDLALGEHWRLNLAWRYHTGWPTTSISGRLAEAVDGDLEDDDFEEMDLGEDGGLEEDDEDEDPEVIPVLGPLNAERISPYHRLDLRASREWQLRRGQLSLFFEVQNVYDRKNVAGFDIEFEVGDEDEIILNSVEEVWGGFLPSFGVTWEF